MRFTVFALLVVLLLGCVSIETKNTEEIKWYNLKEGVALARKLQRPCVVDFYFPGGCRRCSRFSQTVYSDLRVIKKMNSEFIPIRINLARPLTPQEQALGKRFKYNHECLLLFLDEEGNIIEDLTGKQLCFTDYVEPERFLKYLDLALKKALKKH